MENNTNFNFGYGIKEQAKAYCKNNGKGAGIWFYVCQRLVL